MLERKRDRLSALLLISSIAVLFCGAYAQSSSAVGIPKPASSPTAQCNALFPSGTEAPNLGNEPAATQNLSGFFGPLEKILGDSAGIAAIALMLSFDVIGIGYVINKLVPSTNLGNWLGREYWETAKSVILVVVIFSVMSIIGGVGTMLSGSSGAVNYGNALSTNIGGLISSSEAYLCTVNSQANVALINMVPTLMGLGALESFKISWQGLPVPPVAGALPVFRSGLNFGVFQSLLAQIEFKFLGQWLSIFIDFMLYLIVPIKLVFSSQVIVLPFLVAIGLVFLIPAGLVLRAMPLFRGIGGTLIALGIGFSIIWPGILVLFNTPASYLFCSALSPNFCDTSIGPSTVTAAVQVQAQTFAQDYCNLGLATQTCMTAYELINGLWPSGISNLGYSELVVPFETMSSIYPALNLFIQYTSYLIFQLFFLFIVDLMMFYAITDNIARMLGGTIKLQLGRRLKLV